ncbi:MAG TPA: VanZ family protein [Actinomycetota bacterium]|nr:VanZ family protein [Actinomycetota bacterium]
MPRRVKAWLPAALVAGLIFVLSHQPSFGIVLYGWVSELVSNIVHFIEYAMLAAAIAFGLRTEGMDAEDAGKLAILVAVLFGVTDEIHQRFVPGRSSSPLDLIPDLAGAWTGVRLSAEWKKRRGKRRSGARP